MGDALVNYGVFLWTSHYWSDVQGLGREGVILDRNEVVVGLQFNNPLILGNYQAPAEFCSQLFFGHPVNYIGGEEDFGRPRGGVECWAGHLVFGLGAHQCGAFARSSSRLVTAARTSQSPDIYSGNLPRAPWLLHFMCNPQPPLLVLAYQVSQSFHLFEHLLFCSHPTLFDLKF